MKEFFQRNKSLFIFLCTIVTLWLGLLGFAEHFDTIVTIHKGFINPNVWANFDGTHYISIGKIGYVWQEQAFFPLYPIVIHFVGTYIFSKSFVPAGIFISLLFLPLMLFFFAKLIELDSPRKVAYWAILFLLLFPTGFFLRAAYTESFFLLLTISSFYLARKKHFFLSSILALLASATRVVGIFLLPAILFEYFVDTKWKISKKSGSIFSLLSIVILSPIGLLSYMFYLWKMYGDPLLFFHNLSIYGAQRSSKLILLPQVLLRYAKILITVPMTSFTFQIALLELAVFLGMATCLILLWRRMRPSYLVYSLGAVLLPTLSGSLSSFPRYALALFPIFILLGSIRNNFVKILLLMLFGTLEIVLCMLFLRGYFIS